MFLSKERKWKNSLWSLILVGVWFVVAPFLPWFERAASSSVDPPGISLTDPSLVAALVLIAVGVASIGIALAILDDKRKARVSSYYGALAAAGTAATAVTCLSIFAPPTQLMGAIKLEALMDGITAPFMTLVMSIALIFSAIEIYREGRRDDRAELASDAGDVAGNGSPL